MKGSIHTYNSVELTVLAEPDKAKQLNLACFLEQACIVGFHPKTTVSEIPANCTCGYYRF